MSAGVQLFNLHPSFVQISQCVNLFMRRVIWINNKAIFSSVECVTTSSAPFPGDSALMWVLNLQTSLMSEDGGHPQNPGCCSTCMVTRWQAPWVSATVATSGPSAWSQFPTHGLILLTAQGCRQKAELTGLTGSPGAAMHWLFIPWLCCCQDVTSWSTPMGPSLSFPKSPSLCYMYDGGREQSTDGHGSRMLQLRYTSFPDFQPVFHQTSEY